MEPHKTALIAGLLIGGFLGYRYAGRLTGYPPYGTILDLIRMNRASRIVVNPSLGDQIQNVGDSVRGVVGTVSDALSVLHNIFGADGATPHGDVIYDYGTADANE